MEKEKLVWLGKGVFTRAGKIYKYGHVIPSNINEKELSSLKKKKLVGNPVKMATISQSNNLLEIQAKKIKELRAELAEKDKLIKDLETSTAPE
jgi:hypothetical protein